MPDEKPPFTVLKKKDIAENVLAVIKDKEDLSEIETSLHRIENRYNKSQFAEREVFSQVLSSSLILARAIRRMSTEMEGLKKEVAELRGVAA